MWKGIEAALLNKLRARIETRLLNPLEDLYRPDKLAAWGCIKELEEGDLSQVLAIVPARNEEEQIVRTLD